MKYRKFGKIDYQVSALGFGAMRLPTFDNKPMSGEINEAESTRLIRSAIDRGVNYLDTAYVYHNGNSEIVVGKALLEGYRAKIKLATKSPLWIVNSAADFDKYLDEQLVKLQTDHIDFYLMHGIGKERWETIQKLGLMECAEKAIKAGKICHIGFSFHDKAEAFRPIIDAYDKWEFCQIQYNYMDTENQAGTEGLNYAAAKGIPVIVMEPLLGGRLAKPPADVKKIFDEYGTKRSPAQWAMQWVWNQPGIVTLLSGMNSMAQVEENLQAAETLSTQPLTLEDKKLIIQARAAFLKRASVPCTKCGYCLPCPQGVNIPEIIELYNNGIVYNDMASSKFMYGRFFDEAERADKCAQCGQCDAKCPQGIEISKLMPEIHEKLK